MMFGLRIATLFLLLALPASANEWPFGSRGFGGTKLDLYNLGLIGAKARDEASPKIDPNTPPKMGRRAVQMDRPANDHGPDRLAVEVLFPGGPAEKAGLQIDDVIVGVNGRKFSKGSLAAIAKALLKAEAGKGEVSLSVQRDGKGRTQKIVVKIPVAGKFAGKPTQGEGREALIQGALKWLAEQQGSAGGFRASLSGSNGGVVQTSLAGLAWIGGGSDLRSGPHRENLRRAAEYVAATLPNLGSMSKGRGGANWNQSNWGLAHGCTFLGELLLRAPEGAVATGQSMPVGPSFKQALHDAAKKLAANQEQSGGWAHGPGGKNALDYLELNIVTGLALCGLGLAEQNGFTIPDGVIEKAEEYLRASSGGDGGVGYSTSPGQKGQGNIGRSGSAWLGYLALHKKKAGWAQKMGKYVARNTDKALGGHASLMQHILFAGVASAASGNAAEKKFWKAMERDLVLARSPDGSFQPRPWHESLAMGSNSDVGVGDVWTTAAWACVLVAPATGDGKRGFRGLFGLEIKG